MTTLPTKPGFYWWRASGVEECMMIHVRDYGQLAAYDVEQHKFGGISLRNWAKLYPVGEWIEVERP